MFKRKRKPLAQLWVRYSQVGGWWTTRVTDGNMVIGGGRYSTECDALDAAEEDFGQYFPGLSVPEPRIFRTGAEYYAAIMASEGRR